MAGGGMRQAGVLAAAASHALDHHVDRLTDDHRRAQRLAQAFAELPGLHVAPVHTNIVFVDIAPSAKEKAVGLVDFLAARGVLANGLYRLRFVTHLDVDDAGVERAIAAMRERFSGA
jgi:threonine aldolase